MLQTAKITSKTMINPILKRLALSGSNPMVSTTFSKILGKCYLFCMGSILFLMMLNFMFEEYRNVSTLIGDLIVGVGFLQITVKHYTAMVHSNKLSDMINSAWANFWPMDAPVSKMDSLNSKLKQDIMNLCQKAIWMTEIYNFVTIAAVLSLIVKPIFLGDKNLIMEIWIPQKEVLRISPYYEVLNVIEGIIIFLGAYICVIQLDKLFIVTICLVYVQFKMLRKKILLIGQENEGISYEIMKQCVIHHNTVLRFTENFEAIYSTLFMPSVGSSVFIATVCMWGVMADDSISNRFSCVFVYGAVMSQVFSYCLAGQIIQDSATSIGEAAYYCDWTKMPDRRVRMGLIMIILQSQRKLELTVGGIMILCLESFAALARATFSFLAFLINMKDK